MKGAHVLNGRVEVEWQRRALSECECSTREKKSLCVLELEGNGGGARGPKGLWLRERGFLRCLALERPVGRGSCVRRDENLRRSGPY